MKQISALLVIMMLLACNEQPAQTSSAPAAPKDSIPANDSSCSTKTIMDPNDPKPMALMMRQLAENADSMKAQLQRGETLNEKRYPFIRFYLAEPTDPAVLEPQFYENARLFQEAYKQLFAHPAEQTKYYNLVIDKCVGCHQSYCSGPLKRIRKLYISE